VDRRARGRASVWKRRRLIRTSASGHGPGGSVADRAAVIVSGPRAPVARAPGPAAEQPAPHRFAVLDRTLVAGRVLNDHRGGGLAESHCEYDAVHPMHLLKKKAGDNKATPSLCSLTSPF